MYSWLRFDVYSQVRQPYSRELAYLSPQIAVCSPSPVSSGSWIIFERSEVREWIHFFKVILSVLFHSWGISKTHKRHVVFTVCCCCCLVTKQRPTLCDPMDCSTPGFPALHSLPKLVQTHVHWVGDAIQPSHPLSSPSPPASNPSWHQSLFQRAGSSHQATKLL